MDLNKYINKIEKEIKELLIIGMKYNEEGKILIKSYINELKVIHLLLKETTEKDKLILKSMKKEINKLLKKNDNIKNILKKEIYLKNLNN